MSPFLNGYNQSLFLDAIDAERHRRQLVVDDRLLFVCLHRDGTLLRRDELRALDAVLVVHTLVSKRDGLCRCSPSQVLQVQRDGLCLLRRVCHLDDDLSSILVVTCRGEESVLTLLSCYRDTLFPSGQL